MSCPIRIACLLAMTLASCGVAPPDSLHPAVTIEMTNVSFHPDPITIQKGGTVCWKNADTVNRWPASNIHPTHEIFPEFDQKRGLEPEETWCFAFSKQGIWKYHDHLYPEFAGTVNVE